MKVTLDAVRLWRMTESCCSCAASRMRRASASSRSCSALAFASCSRRTQCQPATPLTAEHRCRCQMIVTPF